MDLTPALPGQIPRVENYLRVLALLLSVDDVKEQTATAASTVIRASSEVRHMLATNVRYLFLSTLRQVKGSVRLRIMFKAILKIGNVLNQGTKKRSIASTCPSHPVKPNILTCASCTCVCIKRIVELLGLK